MAANQKIYGDTLTPSYPASLSVKLRPSGFLPALQQKALVPSGETILSSFKYFSKQQYCAWLKKDEISNELLHIIAPEHRKETNGLDFIYQLKRLKITNLVEADDVEVDLHLRCWLRPKCDHLLMRCYYC